MTEPTPAATVVPLRDGADGLEVLLLRRNSRGAFGGMWVFPGGQVDEADWVGVDPTGGEPSAIAASRRAAVREAAEEAGLDLAEGDLVTLSFWLPPPEAPRRFATWFFLGPAHDAAPVVVDQGEIHEHQWVNPSRALLARDGGHLELAPPTYTTLWGLTPHPDVSSALSAAATRTPERFETHVARTGPGGPLITLWAGDAGYDDRDPDHPGPRRRLVLDEAGWRIEMSS